MKYSYILFTWRIAFCAAVGGYLAAELTWYFFPISTGTADDLLAMFHFFLFSASFILALVYTTHICWMVVRRCRDEPKLARAIVVHSKRK